MIYDNFEVDFYFERLWYDIEDGNGSEQKRLTNLYDKNFLEYENNISKISIQFNWK